MESTGQGHVHAMLAVFDDLSSEQGPGPRPGSPAVIEATAYVRPLSIQTAYSQGVMALESARDHLEAVDLIARFGQPSVAHWTNLRGALEASSIAAWLFDPSIIAHDRVSRSLALRFSTLTQQLKIASGEGDTNKVAKVKLRIDDVERIATSLGFVAIRNKDGVRDGIGQRKPQISDLAEAQFDFRNVYRFLSSVAHSDSAVIAGLGFKKVGNIGVGQALLERDVSSEQLRLAVGNAIMLYARPLWMQMTQFGFDHKRAAAALEQVYDQMGLANSDQVRFWRSDLANVSRSKQ